MNKSQIALTALAVILVAGWLFFNRDAIFTRPAGQEVQNIIASFLCKDSKSVIATFSSADAALTLSDGRTMTLPRAQSADGARYANADESVVFWNVGNTAFITEGKDGAETYSGCIVASAAPTGWVATLNSQFAFTLSHPAGYIVKDPFTYQALGPGKDIAGIAFVVPKEAVAGTNLSADSFVSVERIPNAPTCTAALFLPDVKAVANVADNGTDYSVATSSGAGAGNFYNEVVYAIPGTNPCTAVRYLIHSTNIANYPAGAVTEFNQDAVLQEFDAIRRTLVLGR